MKIVLTGQSLITADFRELTPNALDRVGPLLEGDVVFTNFEGAIVEKGDSLENVNALSSSLATPESMDALVDAGFNLMSLANNHSSDLASKGIINTLKRAKALNIASSGIGMTIEEALAPAFLKTEAGTVALISHNTSSGPLEEIRGKVEKGAAVNELPLEGGIDGVDAGHPVEESAKRILENINKAKEKADIVISYHHTHAYDKEFGNVMMNRLPDRLVPANWVKKWAHRQIEAGADIVVMQGAPLIHGVEIYNGCPIFYDMGNFIFNLNPMIDKMDFFEDAVWDSVIAHVNYEGRILKSITFYPIVLNKQGQGDGDQFMATRGIPNPATGEKAKEILQRIVGATTDLGTHIEMKNDYAEILLA